MKNLLQSLKNTLYLHQENKINYKQIDGDND